MAELIKEIKTNGHSLICIANPPDIFPDLPDSEWDLFKTQMFTWYTDFLAFSGRGDNWSYFVKIYSANELSIREDTSIAILLPFTVPPEGTLLVSGSYGNPSFPFDIAPGYYKLLYETRFLTDQEIESSGHYDYLLEELKDPGVDFWDERRPELCLFTFVPTSNLVIPQVIKGFQLRQELILHNQSRPAGFD